jgi:trans-2,3-dihydro-3-hydroxyanthranilate isomerase
VEVGSTGNPFLFVALRDRSAVDRAAPDASALSKLPAEAMGVGVFVFAPDDNPGRVYARMFAPHSGITEDPATGSAAGPLGAYLTRHGIVRGSGELTIICEQGTKIRRQSFLHIRLRATPEGARDLQVGGGVMPVLEGQLTLP